MDTINQLLAAHRAALAAILVSLPFGLTSTAALAQTALSQAAFSQTALSPATLSPAKPLQTAPQHAYSAGAKLQPRPSEGESLRSADTTAVQSLLESLGRDVAVNQPVSAPTDIYGKPIGSSPGLSPPGLKAKPKS
jgi:hypothetical protein